MIDPAAPPVKRFSRRHRRPCTCRQPPRRRLRPGCGL